MRKFILVENYRKDDVDFSCDALWKRLAELEKDNVYNIVLDGDWYHDKIDSKIEGFLIALDHLGIKYELEKRKTNSQDDSLY